MKDDLLCGAEAIAEFVRLDVATIYRLHRAGRLPTHKIGGQIRLRKSVYLSWVEEQECRNSRGLMLPPLPLLDRAAE